MNKYVEHKNRQQAEFNKLPMKAAFGDKQFREMMEEWHLDARCKEDLSKVVPLVYGAYCLKKDKHLFDELLQKHLKEDEEFYKDDENLKDALYYEFGNHECGYTYTPADALPALGLSWNDVVTNKRIAHIFNETWNKFLDNNN